MLAPLLPCGCYHMRVTAEPLPALETVAPDNGHDPFPAACAALRQDGYIVPEPERNGRSALTAFRHIATETGFTQPTGGREYYLRLRISAIRQQGRQTLRLEPAELELRTSYVFGEDGQVLWMRKRYPYEQYPGMFDLSYVNREMDRVRALLEQTLNGKESKWSPTTE